MNPIDTMVPASQPQLAIHLLGELRLSFNGNPLKGKLHRKVQALLAYLAVESDLRHMREHLATLFWPALPVDMARTNLRQTLYYLRLALGTDAHRFLSVNRDTVHLVHGPQCWVDVQALSGTEPPCPACAKTTADNLCQDCLNKLKHRFDHYKGEFLAGFSLPDAPDFERWRDTQRETLRCHALALAEQLCDNVEARGEIKVAIMYAQRCIALEPWNESNQRHLMRLLADNGQHGAALSYYDAYLEGLAQELNIEPEPRTRELFEQIHKNSQSLRQPPADAAPQTSLDSRVRRCQVTVVCCHIDQLINNYTEDVEQLAEPKMACVDILRSHGGHVTLGHGGYIFAYLGYPIASEKAADNAVLAASELQARFASRFMFRAGIQTGTIITSFDPALPDIIGATSTDALHLCQRAARGEILVNKTTEQMLRGRFKLHPLGHSHTQALSAHYKLVSKMDHDGKQDAAQRSTLLIGRHHEWSRLKALWKLATQGHKQLLLLRGEAGLGKSRLVRAVRDMAHKTPANIRELHCFPEHQHTPLYPLITLLESIFGFADHDSTAARHAKLLAYLSEYHPTLAHTADSVLASLLTIAPPGTTVQPPRVRKRQTLDIVLLLLDSLAARQPLLLIIEDLQWLDLSSMDMLEHLAQREAPAPMFILLTARDNVKPDWLCSSATMELLPLKNKDIARLVQATAPTLSPDAVQHIVTRADGIPLYAEELALMKSDAWDSDEAIPATLHYLLLARLDAVPHTQRLMQLAATIGRNFDPELLRHAADLDEARVETTLRRLSDAQLISARPAPHNDFQFHHALIQEAAYTSQIASDRQEAHQCIAKTLHKHFPQRAEQQPGQVARHYTAAGNVIAALPWWIKAGQQALRVSAHAEASEHLRTGLTLVNELQPNNARDALELSLLLPLGHALLALHGYGSEEATHVYDRARALTKEQTPERQQFETLWGQWMVSSSRTGSGFLESKRLARQLLDVAQKSGHVDLIVQACSANTNIAVWRNDLDLAIQYAQAGLAHIGQTPQQNTMDGPDPHVTTLAHLSWVYSRQGRPCDAREASNRSIKLAETLNNPDTTCFALFFAAMLESFCGKVAYVKAYADQLSAIADMHKMILWQGANELMQGWVQAFNGDAQGPLRIEAGVQSFKEVMPGVSACALHVLARAYGLLGQRDEQLLAIDRGLRAADQVHERFFKSDFLRLRRGCIIRQTQKWAQNSPCAGIG